MEANLPENLQPENLQTIVPKTWAELAVACVKLLETDRKAYAIVLSEQQAKIDEMVKVLVKLKLLVKLRPFIAAYEASAQEEIYGEMIDDALKLARGK